ncbi:MAG: hypothetical protein DMG32_21345 [Acidobacteria bacterium]|nr:MAG: hypothetical protein DMG32_21345 [Acidobacteriota bacterium]
MQALRWRVVVLWVTGVLWSPALMQAQSLPLGPRHDAGQSITAAFEGWFPNQDGTYSILLGYYNRNRKEDLDIPVGPSNRIEPGGPDQGQPTHFLPGRQWGVFTITVPKDFGAKKLTWTIVANGQTTVVPASLDPLWEVSPFVEASGNTPPTIRFEGGASVQGPRPISETFSTAVGNPLTLALWVSDDAKTILGMKPPKTPPVVLTWSKFRGPGVVTFSDAKPTVELARVEAGGGGVSGTASTSATFSEPGEYILLVVANDWSGNGGHGFQCCWTNAQVRVSVKP